MKIVKFVYINETEPATELRGRTQQLLNYEHYIRQRNSSKQACDIAICEPSICQSQYLHNHYVCRIVCLCARLYERCDTLFCKQPALYSYSVDTVCHRSLEPNKTYLMHIRIRSTSIQSY